MSTQLERANRFRALHNGPRAFVVANVWDAGSARIAAGIGFPALATSSGAAAGILGRRDRHITRDEALMQARGITSAVDLPISADLEKGFADEPAGVAETIRLAADAGLVGCTIEDRIGDANQSRFDFNLAVERVAAAVEAARALAFPFMLTARTENFVNGFPDLDDTLKRLLAFDKAGADVLMAPGLPTIEAVRTVCSSVAKPVNFMAGIRGRSFSVAELEAAGVRRISLATSLYRAAMSGLAEAAREVIDHGTFGYMDRGLTSAELAGFMEG